MRDFYLFVKNFGFVNFLFVALTFTNFLGYGYLYGYLAVALILFKKNALQRDLDVLFLVLFIFSIVYSLFYFMDPWKGLQFFLIYMLSPAAFYLWGKQVPIALNRNEKILPVLMLLGVIYSLPAMISVLQNIAVGGFAQHERSIAMFWGGQKIGATGMAQFFMFNMCIPAIFLSLRKKFNLLLTILFLVSFVLSLACVLRLGSRTLLGIMLMSVVFALLLLIPKLTFKQTLVRFGILAVFIIAIIQNVSFDFDSEIFTTFASRMEDGGVEDLASGGGRVDLWDKSITYMKSHPFGWPLDRFGYSHNLWLDTFRVGGFISFFILLIFTFQILYLLRKMYLLKKVSLSLRLLFALYSLSFLSIFMVEPGIDGNFSLFIFFCLFCGTMQSIYMSDFSNP
ncbi:O-Antigen ligase [Muriicola jejuensis]|uniref:O-antigen ligase-related domain-containing protein n=1 Tax=Muriicola jejuensis TaxID=504488 RepID=A0A6P0UE79_9FLAO|nr:O-antigen ligase family protein [Muriicola jejuensis]NER11525.1 hypothetical protein [Muriicola jejuensis]SMP20066.1 O-Antigen ligase [Muriicola jejuensis]